MVARVVAKSMQTLDIADMDEAIRFLLSLRTNHFDHISPGKTGQCDADVYKRPIRGKMAYIKFYIDDDDPEVVVISLHEDEK